jgi:hypothetical protein
VTKVAMGTKPEMYASLLDSAHQSGLSVELTRGNLMFYVTRPEQDVYPTTEVMWVAAPSLVENKAKKSFEGAWDRLSVEVA